MHAAVDSIIWMTVFPDDFSAGWAVKTLLACCFASALLAQASDTSRSDHLSSVNVLLLEGSACDFVSVIAWDEVKIQISFFNLRLNFSA